MILPAVSVPRLLVRPPLKSPPALCEIVIQVFGGLIRPLYVRRWQRRVQRCHELQKAIGNCSSRDTLEALIGRPRYSLDGTGFRMSHPDSDAIVPDFVEVYQTRGCQVDLWFERGVGTLKLVMPEVTWWDLILGEGITVVSRPMNSV